ncbi:RNA-directed 5'-3' RNA polymerase [Emydomyces testavorans]|uniref:RNA-dependent RNA polymerase n=1 Tax=Emydomyces testavorans TaxID=2070801 RepID=A0AAF0DN94_9EURO|nr:RNA-directed 5'-3' RNA polymerase [Emydomyces testavorans]
MEIFCRNVPEQVREKHLKKEFTFVLARFSIVTFSCRRAGKKNAYLTILDGDKAQRLLDEHGQDDARKQKPARLLKMFNQPIYLTKSRNEADEYLLRTLQLEEEKRLASQAANSKTANVPEPPISNVGSVPTDHNANSQVNRIKKFPVTTMSCGIWDYHHGHPAFVEFFRCPGIGKVVFGKSMLRVTMSNVAPSTEYYLEFSYSTVRSIHIGTSQQASVTVTADIAPRFFISDPMEKLKAQTAKMANKYAQVPTKRRVGHFGGNHEITSGACFTYRFELQDRRDTYAIRNLQGNDSFPPINRWVDRRVAYTQPFVFLKAQFDSFLHRQQVPFVLKFQIAKLVWNGEISPTKVLQLYPRILQLLAVHGVERIVEGLKSLTLEYPDPDTHILDVDANSIASLLETTIDRAIFQRNDRLNLTHPKYVKAHRAQVTPSGIYLYGPNTEPKNRVLRQYSEYINHFLRVEFTDETGDPVYFDPRASLDEIFHGRFKDVLKQGIIIGERCFSFLGFSHSSLRSQTCWFVAPFTTDTGEHFDAQSIIQGLGSFNHIFSPSKLAARIGQTFSDTQTSIAIPEDAVYFNEPDVKRNGRVFSDGVGTLSASLMYKIWREYALRERVKPTVFQIRFAAPCMLGAKGMVSLDTRLKGGQLRLRESMVKFVAKKALNIEVCGSGIKALPFYLNTQIIKILEDLGVNQRAFLELQSDEVNRLRSLQQSPSKAGYLLEETNVAKGVRLPWLLQIVQGLGLHHDRDPFLRSVIQLAVFLKMRDLKYRARIRVPQAITLYGIMDETGYLNEGEIFCTFLTEEGVREILVHDRIIITRSPALHPGDVQYVNAVDVPTNSPLRNLHNCVVFSQHGTRDLPSMLSGGDLDGDLYNVIYDERLIPPRTCEPADYPRVEERLLDRPVVRDDIIDFFVTFMQQDQLGRIATVHQAIADQASNGTLDHKCLLLAELHSIAVDFSKSGIPVDLSRIPKRPRYYPDFMAPNPRIRISESIEVIEDEDYLLDEEDDDDDERPQRRYYKSNHILGLLYRNIDEQEFLGGLRSASKLKRDDNTVLQAIWNYVASETEGFQWDHLVEDGRKTKDIYEDYLRATMQQYSKTPWKSSLTEIEVFVGSILGQNSKPTRRDKEASNEMRNSYQELVNFTISMILDRESGGTESLERSIACFWVALNEGHTRTQGRHKEKLLSFPWIAAMVCLEEVDKFQRTIIAY